jgi:hypothetical protein
MDVPRDDVLLLPLDSDPAGLRPSLGDWRLGDCLRPSLWDRRLGDCFTFVASPDVPTPVPACSNRAALFFIASTRPWSSSAFE